jgi:uncharacterized protein YjiK
MMASRRIALILGLIAFASACQSKEEQKKVEAAALARREQRLEARLAKADKDTSKDAPVAMWIMPTELREISGLALTPDGRLLAHDDEIGKVYEIDPRRGFIIKSFLVGKGLHGDFEGITLAGPDIYLLASNGNLFRFREGDNGTIVPYQKLDLHLKKACEFEGVAYQADSAWLVLPCKTVHTKDLKDDMVIYRWKIGTNDSSGISMLTVPQSEAIGSNKWKVFRPSDITIDPVTGDYVIISSIDKGLLVMTPDGEVLRSEALPGKHHQAEGVAITKDSVLIISDEATTKPAAITLYRWHR